MLTHLIRTSHFTCGEIEARRPSRAGTVAQFKLDMTQSSVSEHFHSPARKCHRGDAHLRVWVVLSSRERGFTRVDGTWFLTVLSEEME